MTPDCACTWKFVWHGFGTDSGYQERDSTITEYAHDCTTPTHAALAALLTPKETS